MAESLLSSVVPAPLRGWNARDPVPLMKKGDAIFLDNLIPSQTGCKLREGYTKFADLPSDTVLDPHNIESLMSYYKPDGTAKLFAACNSGIYDVTSGGTVSAVSSSATYGRWQHTLITTAGGSFLWCCNGTDKSRYYDGSAWTVLDGTSSPALTGVTSANIINVSLFKRRLIFCCKDSLSFWYLPVTSVAGAATEFPLGALFARGGHLVATGTWTVDGGTGIDDYFVAITSEGEVALYRGTDPADAANWALVGVFFLAPPIGRRCLQKVGGDLLFLTTAGILPASKVFSSDGFDPSIAKSDRIRSAFSNFAKSKKSLFGWEMQISYGNDPLLIVNVPYLDILGKNIIRSYQFVLNLTLGAWCRFVGIDAACFEDFSGVVYFARHNKVYKLFEGATNDDEKAIVAKAMSSFAPMARGSNSRIVLLRPMFTVTSQITVNIGIDSNYEITTTSSSGAINYESALSEWDSAIFDQSRWTRYFVSDAWQSVNCKMGAVHAIRLNFSSKNVSIEWSATQLVAEPGGIL